MFWKHQGFDGFFSSQTRTSLAKRGAETIWHEQTQNETVLWKGKGVKSLELKLKPGDSKAEINLLTGHLFSWRQMKISQEIKFLPVHMNSQIMPTDHERSKRTKKKQIPRSTEQQCLLGSKCLILATFENVNLRWTFVPEMWKKNASNFACGSAPNESSSLSFWAAEKTAFASAVWCGRNLVGSKNAHHKTLISVAAKTYSIHH